MEVIHLQGNPSVTAGCAVDLPPCRTLCAPSFTTSLVSSQNNRDPFQKITRDGLNHFAYPFLWVIICWIDLLSHGVNKVSMTFVKTGVILFFRIERVIFGGKIFPLH